MKAFVIIAYDSEGGETEVMAVANSEERAKKEIEHFKLDDDDNEIDYNEYSIEEYEVLT